MFKLLNVTTKIVDNTSCKSDLHCKLQMLNLIESRLKWHLLTSEVKKITKTFTYLILFN